MYVAFNFSRAYATKGEIRMKYYVHTLTDNQNDHEVHTETCFRLPDANNRKELGEFSSCEPAVKAAKIWVTRG